MFFEKIINESGTYFYYPCLNQEAKKGTIIFIHGFATTSEYHDVFIPFINQSFDYYAIQLPGSGIQEWNKLDKNPTVDDMVLYCVEVIRSMNLIEPFFLIGHSMGGGLALRVANLLKSKVKALILSTPMNSRIPLYKIKNYFLFNPKNFKKAFKLTNILYYDFPKTFNNNQEKMQQYIKNELEYQKKHRTFFIKLKKSMFSLHNLKISKANEKQILIPTLVLAGRFDKIIPWKSLVKAFNKGANKDKEFVRVEIMNDSSHIPFQEQAKDYANRIKEFINSIH